MKGDPVHLELYRLVLMEANTDESNGSVITSLTAGDKINLGSESNVAAEISPSTGTNAYLNIVRLA